MLLLLLLKMVLLLVCWMNDEKWSTVLGYSRLIAKIIFDAAINVKWATQILARRSEEAH